jgi:uridine phosphorylase
MQVLNENALQASFASSTLKSRLMHYLRESYQHCHRQMRLAEQFQQSTNNWHSEMINTIDMDAQRLMTLADRRQHAKYMQHVASSIDNHSEENLDKIETRST